MSGRTICGRPDTEAPFVWAAFRDLPRKDRYAAVEVLVVKLEALPDPRARAVSYICADRQVPADRPEFRALLARWAVSEKIYFREAAAELKAKLEAPNTFVPRNARPGGRPERTRSRRHRVQARCAGRFKRDGWSHHRRYVCRTGDGPRVDRLVPLPDDREGKLRSVWTESGSDYQDWKRFSSVSFGGKFVWVTCERLKADPVLLVLDPAIGKVWDASTAEGLPRPPAREKEKENRGAPALMACALEPRRACLTGWFSGRSWVGIADFDAKTGAVTVKVTHEARAVRDGDEKDQWKKTTVGCRPSFVALLTGPAGAGGKRERRVLIGRIGGAVHGLTEHPLVVRPDGVVEGALETHRIWNPPAQDTCVVANGSLYYLELYSEGQKIRTHLARVGLPGPTKDILCARMPRTPNAAFRVTVHGNKTHAVIEQWQQVEQPRVIDRTAEWWTTDLDGKNPKRVATDLPGMRGLWTSAHYGLVALIDHGLNSPPVLNTVEFVAAPPSVAVVPKNNPVAVMPQKPVGAPPKAEPEPKSGAVARAGGGRGALVRDRVRGEDGVLLRPRGEGPTRFAEGGTRTGPQSDRGRP